MADDVTRSDMALTKPELASEPVYRVKNVDADGRRGSQEKFEENLKRQKQKQGEGTTDEPALPEADTPAAVLPPIHDDVILSSRAQELLEAKAEPPVPSGEAPPPKPEPPPGHINILA